MKGSLLIKISPGILPIATGVFLLGALAPVLQAAEPVIEIRRVVDDATPGAVHLEGKRAAVVAKRVQVPVKKISVAQVPLLKGDEIEIIDYYSTPDNFMFAGMGLEIGFPEVRQRVAESLKGKEGETKYVVLIDGVVSTEPGIIWEYDGRFKSFALFFPNNVDAPRIGKMLFRHLRERFALVLYPAGEGGKLASNTPVFDRHTYGDLIHFIVEMKRWLKMSRNPDQVTSTELNKKGGIFEHAAVHWPQFREWLDQQTGSHGDKSKCNMWDAIQYLTPYMNEANVDWQG